MILAAVVMSVSCAVGSSKADPAPAPDPVEATVPLTKDQIDAYRAAGYTVTVKSVVGGSRTDTVNGTSTGSGFDGKGKEITDTSKSDPPELNLGMDSGSGGGVDAKSHGIGFSAIAGWNAGQWVCLVVGLILVGGGAYCALMVPPLKKIGTIAAAVGVGAMATAFYPIVLPFVAAGGAIALAWPAITAALKQHGLSGEVDKLTSASKAAIAALTNPNLLTPEQIAANAKALAAEAHGSETDVPVLHALLAEDANLKYAGTA